MGTKSSPDDDEEVLQLSEAIIRRVKWSYKSLLERCGLKMLRFFEKFGKPPFPDLLPVNRCVNDVKRVCRGRIEAALPPTFTTHSSENQTSDRLRIGGNLLVTNSSIDCESFISGLSSPLINLYMVSSAEGWICGKLDTLPSLDAPPRHLRDKCEDTIACQSAQITMVRSSGKKAESNNIQRSK